jgi:hypothetical protein
MDPGKIVTASVRVGSTIPFSEIPGETLPSILEELIFAVRSAIASETDFCLLFLARRSTFATVSTLYASSIPKFLDFMMRNT